MKEIIKDLNSALVIVKAASEKLAGFKQKALESEDIDLQGIEDVLEYVDSAKCELEEALDEIPYVMGEK